MELKNGTSTELDEAIKVIENTIKDIDKEITEGTHSRTMIDNYIKCYNEQKQLLEWLKELKEYKSEIKQAVHIGYSEGVKDGAILELNSIRKEIKEHQSKYTDRWIMGVTDFKFGNYRAYEETVKIIDRHITDIKRGTE